MSCQSAPGCDSKSCGTSLYAQNLGGRWEVNNTEYDG
ncbi:unnamed protein product, partial [Staurois parvus]